MVLCVSLLIYMTEATIKLVVCIVLIVTNFSSPLHARHYGKIENRGYENTCTKSPMGEVNNSFIYDLQMYGNRVRKEKRSISSSNERAPIP